MQTKIESIEPRSQVEVHLPDGQVLSGPRGTVAGEFLKVAADKRPAPVVAAIVNGELHELTLPIQMESNLSAVTMADADGARIYRRSLTFLLEVAFSALFPDARLLIDHSVASGGYYCHIQGHPPLSQNEMDDLEKKMRSLVKADLPFERFLYPLNEAVAYFEKQNYPDKVRLLAYRHKDYVTLYKLAGHLDYHHGYMVPSTGYLAWFNLLNTNGGFTLRFPQRSAPTHLLPMPEYPKLLATFRQYGEWLERLGIDNVGALNDAISAGRTREVILVSEALHEQNIASIAGQIADRSNQVRMILISGPSSSGKTTFSRRLAIQLLALGFSPFALELDNYFVDRDKNPKDENGQYDFEALEALNLGQLAEHLQLLVAGKTVQLPRYNFKEGRQEQGDLIQLREDQIIILEGIHGLNPRLIPASLGKRAFRVYVSCLTQINLDRHNRVSTTDTRLIRRIVRDANERGYSAAQTIQRWESVGRGEGRNIFPYQENADVMFNSALVYELSAMVRLAEPLLRQVPFGKKEYIEAKRLLAFLEWFLPVDTELIPDNSLIREFIGGSILKDFKIWKA
ncbi:MAG TPA: nucleoside kinase [Anaerolineae bacterium]|nr:nucleoside kinase [Anaerolineae bacterium]HCM97248.1 nucleoside kinase [Anaerolineae bacterium]